MARPPTPRSWTLALAAGAVLLAPAAADPGDPRAAGARPDPVIVRCLLEPVALGRLPAAAAILVEAETGHVLFEQDADVARAPASLVKMMVQLLAYEDVAAGVVAPGDPIVTSANAATMGGSQVYLREGEVQSLAAMLDAVAIASANDAAMAIAEHLAGSEAAFVERMNARAAELGCEATVFTNVHGLDLRRQARHRTTARDLATIARALTAHERALEVASTWRKPFRDGEFWLDNTNKLLRRCEGLDGLKTGWTPRAGGCFVGTARRDGVRLVAVVLGARPGRDRFRIAARMLEKGFDRAPRWIEPARVGDPIVALGPVAVGKAPVAGDALATALSPGTAAAGTLRILIEETRAPELTLRVRPRPAGDLPGPAGWLDCRLGGRTVATVPAAGAPAAGRL